MPATDEITTAAYQILAADEILSGMCAIYKGTRRPGDAANPSLAIATHRLEPGGGAGMWLCDIVTAVYADMNGDGAHDHETLNSITERAKLLLADTELEFTDAKAFPLIEGESTGPEWDSSHSGESVVESTFGLVFVKF